MLACSSDTGGNSGNGGSPGQGGSTSGGASSGGASSGGASSGGASSGGSNSGGKANGGSSNGGGNNGGGNNGGAGGGNTAGQSGGGRGGAGGGNNGGGNNGGAAGGGSTATFAQVAMILSMKCAGATCHGGSGANAQVNLVDMNGLYTRLTTALPMSTPHCKGSTLVTANDANSLLVKVVSGPTMCTNGTAMESLAKMPDNCSGNSCLTPAQIKTITDWIAAGAPM